LDPKNFLSAWKNQIQFDFWKRRRFFLRGLWFKSSEASRKELIFSEVKFLLGDIYCGTGLQEDRRKIDAHNRLAIETARKFFSFPRTFFLKR
jgi:hypothetical protein